MDKNERAPRVKFPQSTDRTAPGILYKFGWLLHLFPTILSDFKKKSSVARAKARTVVKAANREKCQR